MKLVFATNNAGKLAELKALLGDLRVQILSPAEDTVHFASSSTMSTAAIKTHGPNLRWGVPGGNSRS